MTALVFKGIWNIAKGKLKQKCALLTDNELQFTDGKEDELIGRIQRSAIDKQSKINTPIKPDYCSCRN